MLISISKQPPPLLLTPIERQQRTDAHGARLQALRDTLHGRLKQLAQCCRSHDSGFSAAVRREYPTVTFEQLLQRYIEQDGYASTFPTQKMSLISGDPWQMSVDRADNSQPHHFDNIRLTCCEFNPHGAVAPWSTAKEKELLALVRSPPPLTPWQRLSAERKLVWARVIVLRARHSADTRAEREREKAKKVRDRLATNPAAVTPGWLRPYPERGTCTLTVREVLDKMEAQQGRCALVGVPLRLAYKPNCIWLVSIERTDPTLGYSIDSVIFVALEFNTSVRPWSPPPSTGWTEDKWGRWMQYLERREGL